MKVVKVSSIELSCKLLLPAVTTENSLRSHPQPFIEQIISALHFTTLQKNFLNVYKKVEYEVIDKMRVALKTYAPCKVCQDRLFLTQIYCIKQDVNNYTPYYISSS